MLFVEHDEATCPECGAKLYYGVKQEAASWKITYRCEACEWEARAGRVSKSSIDHEDELWESASDRGQQWVDD